MNQVEKLNLAVSQTLAECWTALSELPESPLRTWGFKNLELAAEKYLTRPKQAAKHMETYWRILEKLHSQTLTEDQK